ncbi:MAG: long-chain fatty acid--CoA ligase [Actinobacteria bacterium]|nr:MAG: long-chain fatty acid--CoA ligase [Actinomycetota bacterium]
MSGDPLAVASLCEAFQRTAARRPHSPALRTLGGDVELTWGDYADRVRRIATGLASLGVGRSDTVALMMVNCPEFHVCDTAALHVGAVPFSVYNTSPADQIAQLFANAANRVVICERQFLERVMQAVANTGVEHVLCVDGAADGATPLGDLERVEESGFDFEAAWRAVRPDDLLTLIYTSGTTGPPKGVEITHANMLAELRATQSVLPVQPGDRMISHLPAAHIADRWGSHYQGMTFGTQLTCVADPRAVAAALPQVRPTVWGAVPRVWEKIHAAVQARVKTEPDPERARALGWAIEAGARKVRAEQAALTGSGPAPDADLLAEYARADELVLGPMREQLGLDAVRVAVSGAAPTPVALLEFFAALGIEICELWGMSETSCCATINPPEKIKIGTVGPAVPGLELRLDVDGELLCRGPLIMRGYRGEPAKTAEAIDADGWLHTGDIAAIDSEGYVTIVDRKKELIINAAGKNMSPANIEAKLKSSSPLIGQAVAVGDGRPYNVALLVLDPDAATAFAAEHQLHDAALAALAQDERVRAAVKAGVGAANEQLSRVEQIKRFEILAVDWEPGGDELTPTMKLKRKPIAMKYAAEIDTLYAERAPRAATAA